MSPKTTYGKPVQATPSRRSTTSAPYSHTRPQRKHAIKQHRHRRAHGVAQQGGLITLDYLITSFASHPYTNHSSLPRNPHANTPDLQLSSPPFWYHQIQPHHFTQAMWSRMEWRKAQSCNRRRISVVLDPVRFGLVWKRGLSVVGGVTRSKWGVVDDVRVFGEDGEARRDSNQSLRGVGWGGWVTSCCRVNVRSVASYFL
ncbi:uncharacterized protein BDR25DRAFT_302833 [Lindgomyces ingoldianus]|uniref:Uncharacterized protein n=1 Tax=Lindgomyces ingoldianus TaxID=673940 RepID=A0ACB6QYB3_9PLEO|nr:uncharacterized protein BDR25DRAFT_302833 [Lindgomyces ingoldianus]KAF2472029.1 hypothetical protein BDR25DRAFT_302833 [Lindgomyces ingoldianus]